MAFNGVLVEEEGLGAPLGGAGACFFVPKRISLIYLKLNGKNPKDPSTKLQPFQHGLLQ